MDFVTDATIRGLHRGLHQTRKPAVYGAHVSLNHAKPAQPCGREWAVLGSNQ